MERILEEVERIVEGDGSPEERLHYVCRTLEREVPHYDWVGFYIVDTRDEGMLYLGPYVGAPTEHVRIPFGKGICGQAAARKEAFIIQDVAREDNYLSCSINVRSEIVIPVMDGDEVIGELDIDSHSISPFRDWDRSLLEAICCMVSPLIREIRERVLGN
ncbi:MAG: GAF domain-containing protein [Candidatus Thermoplasmatota archaeon]|nr:GAF domain-containing protein [Candidatus Thermoplasmatota archaeon]